MSLSDELKDEIEIEIDAIASRQDISESERLWRALSVVNFLQIEFAVGRLELVASPVKRSPDAAMQDLARFRQELAAAQASVQKL